MSDELFDFNAEQEDSELETEVEEQEDSEFVEESVEEEESHEDTHSEDGREAKTAKHYQSLADKRLAEIEAARKEKEELQRKLDELTAQKSKEPEIEAPKRPVKPRNYNKTDALTDPDSESALYDQELQDYLLARDDYNSQMLQKQQETYQKQQLEAAQRQQMEEHKKFYIQGFKDEGYSPTEAEELYQFLVSKDSLDPRKLVQRFKGSSKKSDFENKKQLSELSLPPGAGKGAKSKLSDDDAFFQEFFG